MMTYSAVAMQISHLVLMPCFGFTDMRPFRVKHPWLTSTRFLHAILTSLTLGFLSGWPVHLDASVSLRKSSKRIFPDFQPRKCLYVEQLVI